MAEIVLPDLSYKIMGVLFAVHNELGPGFAEKHYQRAVREEFTKRGVRFKEQLKVSLGKGGLIGCYYIDFVIEDKIVLEIKVSPRFTRENILQVLRYLKETDIELGILASFARRDLIYRRILRGFKAQCFN